MDAHYTYTPVYAPTQPPEHNRSFNPLSVSQTSGPNLPAYSTTLPPLSNGYLPYTSQHSAQGASSTHTVYAPINATVNGLSTSYIAYPRQPSVQYPDQHQIPRSFQRSQQYLPPDSHASTYRPYLQPGRLAEIRPMPNGGFADQINISSVSGSSTQAAFTHNSSSDQSRPTHVVGSQGRRGVLPCTNGRPLAVTTSGASKSSTAGLKKDPVDGKWPCEHCNKKYLHAKHLKRHLLRHSGTRPYACGLCNDTFSRSDILKRHFIKCSIRRGNPTGANHLAHSRATRKSRNELGASLQPLNTSAPPNQISDPSNYGISDFHNVSELNELGYGHASFNDGLPSSANQLSRASSVKGMGKSTPASARGNFTAPNSAGFDSAGFPYSGGQATPDSLTTSGAATPFNYQSDPRSNQLSPNTSMSHSMNGLDLNSISRSLTGPSYSAGTLPHIVEHSHDRSNDMNWPLDHAGEPEDYSGGNYHSHGNIQQNVKSEVNYSNGSFPLNHNYPPFQPPNR